ncbi:MAG: aromatic ring-hydroxylating oxygenase subunit alpha [Novosphingobium sp.]
MNLDDIRRFGASLDQRAAGHSLPQMLYTDPAGYDFDLEAIYARSWLMAGLTCELPKTGSYLALNVGPWPILIVRDRDGAIGAFHNSCRHRGSILCQPGHGSAPKLVCPYHRWTYNLDGSLFAAMRMAPDFDKSSHGLKPVALRTVAGAMFICLADEPPPFDDFGARFAEYAGPLALGDLKLAATELMIEQANWKLVMENGRECYHCGTGHPELALSFPTGFSGNLELASVAATADFGARMESLGLPCAPQEGDWWQIARFPLNEGSSTISMDGKPVVKKLIAGGESGNVGSLRWAIDPHLFAHATSDHVFTFNCMPVSATETHVFSKWYVHRDAVEGVDYDLGSLKELWITTNQQDRELAENNQRGVVSPGYTPGPYSPDGEALTRRFVDWYCATAKEYVAAHD